MTVDNSGLVASALYKTDPVLFAQIDGANSWKSATKTRGARVAKYRRYEEGDHDACITDQMRKMLRLVSSDDAELDDFSGNYCGIIIDKMAGRLKVAEITTDNDDQDQYISDLLEQNDWDALQSVYYRGAIRDGDSYAMVDPQTLRWTKESAYDGFSGIVAIFSPFQEYPIWACKLWSEAENQDISEDDTPSNAVIRIKVYQPNRISNFIGESSGQEATQDGEDDPWTIGVVPLIHFGNLLDNYTQYGKSELRKAIPLQNVYNRTLHSMVMASEFSAFKIAYSIGMEMDKSGITPGAVINLVLQDADGNTVAPNTQDEIEFLKAVRVGELSPSDISQYTNQLSEVVKHISQITQTPIYGVTAQGNLSGEALKQLEIGLVGKVIRFQNENTAAVRQLIELTAKIQGAFREYNNPPKLSGISVNWVKPEIVDTTAEINSTLAVREKAPGLFDDDFYRQRIGGIWRMTQSQITAEGEKAINEQTQAFDMLTGAAGNRPVV